MLAAFNTVLLHQLRTIGGDSGLPHWDPRTEPREGRAAYGQWNVSCFNGSPQENTCVARLFGSRVPIGTALRTAAISPPLMLGENAEPPLRRNHLRSFVWAIEGCCRRRGVKRKDCVSSSPRLSIKQASAL